MNLYELKFIFSWWLNDSFCLNRKEKCPMFWHPFTEYYFFEANDNFRVNPRDMKMKISVSKTKISYPFPFTPIIINSLALTNFSQPCGFAVQFVRYNFLDKSLKILLNFLAFTLALTTCGIWYDDVPEGDGKIHRFQFGNSFSWERQNINLYLNSEIDVTYQYVNTAHRIRCCPPAYNSVDSSQCCQSTFVLSSRRYLISMSGKLKHNQIRQ